MQAGAIRDRRSGGVRSPSQRNCAIASRFHAAMPTTAPMSRLAFKRAPPCRRGHSPPPSRRSRARRTDCDKWPTAIRSSAAAVSTSSAKGGPAGSAHGQRRAARRRSRRRRRGAPSPARPTSHGFPSASTRQNAPPTRALRRRAISAGGSAITDPACGATRRRSPTATQGKGGDAQERFVRLHRRRCSSRLSSRARGPR